MDQLEILYLLIAEHFTNECIGLEEDRQLIRNEKPEENCLSFDEFVFFRIESCSNHDLLVIPDKEKVWYNINKSIINNI